LGDAKQDDIKGAIEYYNEAYKNEKEVLKNKKNDDNDDDKPFIKKIDDYYRFIKATNRNEVLFSAIIGLAECYKEKESMKAYQLYKEASALNYDPSFTFTRMAEIMMRQRKYKQALQDINQSLQADPQKETSNLLKSEILYNLADYKQCSDILHPLLLRSFKDDDEKQQVSLYNMISRTRFIEIIIDCYLHLVDQHLYKTSANPLVHITLDDDDKQKLTSTIDPKDLNQLSSRVVIIHIALMKLISKISKNNPELLPLIQIRLFCINFITKGIMESSIIQSQGEQPNFSHPNFLFKAFKKLSLILINNK